MSGWCHGDTHRLTYATTCLHLDINTHEQLCNGSEGGLRLYEGPTTRSNAHVRKRNIHLFLWWKKKNPKKRTGCTASQLFFFDPESNFWMRCPEMWVFRGRSTSKSWISGTLNSRMVLPRNPSKHFFWKKKKKEEKVRAVQWNQKWILCTLPAGGAVFWGVWGARKRWGRARPCVRTFFHAHHCSRSACQNGASLSAFIKFIDLRS